MADETTASTDTNKLKITTNGEKPQNLAPALPRAQVKAEHADRRLESKLISGAGSSVSARDGDIELSSNNSTHVLLSKNSTILETSMQHKITTNRFDVAADEINVNHHVLNPRLYEMTDYKQVTTGDYQQGLAGNFCVLGTMLVKAWEPDLKRYVMIRRLTRMPMFSPAIAPVKVKSGMEINDPTQAVVDLAAVMDQAKADGKDAAGQVQDAEKKTVSAADQANQAQQENTASQADKTAADKQKADEDKAKEQVNNAQQGKAGAS